MSPIDRIRSRPPRGARADALLARGVFVLVAMQLLGRWAWWLPAPLARRLPNVALERPAGS